MKKNLINCLSSLEDSIKLLNEIGKKCLIVADDNLCLLGTLSDGDVRKAILQGSKLKDNISKIYQSNPFYLNQGFYNQEDIKKIFLEKEYDLIPIVDNNNKIIDTIYLEDVIVSNKNIHTEKLSLPVVIMAGGLGTRLEPFTQILPKALLPLNGKSIIESIITQFTNVGIKEFYLTLNHKSKIIKAYFEDLNLPYNFKYIEEEKALGTAGSLHLLQKSFKTTFFVTNCDILIDTDYSKIVEYHKENNCDLTIVTSTKEFTIPYGACYLDKNNFLDHIKEKPKFSFVVNTGFYLVNPGILSFIPKNKFCNMTDFIKDLKKNNKKVGVYQISEEDWNDIGQWDDYYKSFKK